MKSGKPRPADGSDGTDARIAELVQRVLEAELELQELIGGEVDAVSAPGGAPLLLREAQERLRRSESRLRAIFENEPECVKIISPDGVLVEMNPAGLRMIEAPDAEQVIGKPMLGLVHPDDRAIFMDLHTRASAGATGMAQFRIIGLRGTERWMESHAAPLRAADGTATGVLSVTRDITQSKQAADLLRASEARFRVLFDQAAVGMCLVSSEGEFLRTNHRFCEIVGYSADELLARNCIETTHPDDRAREAVITARLLSGELQSEHWEKRYIRRDGRVVWCHLTLALVPAEAADAQQFVGVIEDITERHLATERLLQNQTMLRIAGRAAKLGGWSIDLPEFRVTWSDETAIIHDCEPGYSPSLQEGIEFYPPEYRDAVSEYVRRITTEGIPWDFEHELITAKQRRIWVRSIAEVRRNEAGEIVRIYGAFQDISDRKAADLALVSSNRALQMLSRCNEALVRSTNEATLLEDICRIAVEVGEFAMAWVGYAQDDAGKTISPMSSAGSEDGYLSELILSWADDQPNGRGPAGQVIRSGDSLVIRDFSAEPSFAPWLASAQARGYVGVVVLPLKNSIRTFGVLVLYAGTVRAPHEDELRVLRELADDLAFGIGTLRSQEERRRLEAAVAEVAASVSGSVGADFFRSLATSAAKAMNADGAFVARFLPGEPAVARTVAAVLDGHVVENFDYVLRGTPCEALADRDECFVLAGAARHFPGSPRLVAADAEAYVGRRLLTSDGQLLGVMYAIFRSPLVDARFVGSTLQIFATRAAGEFERLSADTRIREQATLLEKATDAIIVRDLAHRVLFWNPAAERMFGWSAADALGQLTTELLHPDPDVFEAGVATLLQTGEWKGELNKQTRGRQSITLECRWTLVRDELGNPQSVLCIETDITERKKLEAQFLRAQRMESVGTMASGIAHDMNNILAPIMMSVELLKEDAKDEQTLETLNILASSSQRGADLIRQLLAFARGVDGQRVPVDVHALLVDLQRVMKDVFPKDVSFSVSAMHDLWKTEGDPSQLHQVFLNLCVNARDAMPHGGKLTIGVENVVLDDVYAAMNPQGRAGAFVAVSVSDSGTGMPAAMIDRIFEPFFTTKEVGKGTGLGLSTVLGIVKSHGGFVNVYSEEGTGTQFKVYLPAQAGQKEREETSLTQTMMPRGKGELILLVDDEAGVREIAKKTLVRFGYRVIEAPNGAEAVALYAQHQRDIALVLTDVSMPIMDGVALLAALQSFDPDVRVLISSGLPVNAGVAKAMESGATRFVSKPYTAERLLRSVYEEIHRVRVPRV